MRWFGVLVLSVALLQAQSLDELVESALKKHNSLQVISQKLSSLEEQKELVRNFANPELSLSVSDIQLDDPLNRSIEPMQYQAINIKQRLPFYGKRDAKSSLVEAQQQVVFRSLEEAQVTLSREIKMGVYKLWEYEALLDNLEAYTQLAQKNLELAQNYNASNPSWHVESMRLDFELTELKIEHLTLQSLLSETRAQLRYLVGEDVVGVEQESKKLATLEQYEAKLRNNKGFQKSLDALSVGEAKSELAQLESYTDPSLQVGYFHREAYEDYVSFSLGFALPIYGSETQKQRIAQIELDEASYMSEDKYEELKAKLHALHAKTKMLEATHALLEGESLEKLEHMIELSASMSRSGDSLLKHTKLLQKKLNLQKRAIVVQSRYQQSIASLDALIGER